MAAAWSSKSKVAQNRLRSARPKRLVDPAAEGRVHHQLHAAGLVEEPLEDDVVARWAATPSSPSPAARYGDQLAGGVGAEPARVARRGPGPPRARGLRRRRRRRRGARPRARRSVGDLLGELGRPARRLPDPERDGGVRPFGVGHPDLALGDPADPPRVGAEEEDVAHHRLDGEVLVDRAHRRVVGLGHDAVVAHLGDGTAAGERGQARPAPGAQDAVDAVAVQIGHALAPTGGDALGDERHDRRRSRPRSSAAYGAARRTSSKSSSSVHSSAAATSATICWARMSSGATGWTRGVEPPGAHRGQQRGALHQLVAGHRVEDPLGRAAARVVGAPDPLEEGGDGARRADLAHELDRADVDAELERGGGHQGPQVAGAQAVLGPQAPVLGQAAVVGGDLVGAEPLAQQVGQALGHPPGVDEDRAWCGARRTWAAMRSMISRTARWRPPRPSSELGQLDATPRAHGRGRSRRWPAARAAGRPDEQPRRRLDRPLRGRQPDALGSPAELAGASSRSRVSARCEPRLSRASAWISSTMTVSTCAEHGAGCAPR